MASNESKSWMAHAKEYKYKTLSKINRKFRQITRIFIQQVLLFIDIIWMMKTAGFI